MKIIIWFLNAIGLFYLLYCFVWQCQNGFGEPQNIFLGVMALLVVKYLEEKDCNVGIKCD